MTRKRLIFLLLLTFSTLSFIRLLIITTTISQSSVRQRYLRRPSPANHLSVVTPTPDDPLTPKEFTLLKSLISRKAPCNALFFGFSTPQYLELARLNERGNTVFLEDDSAKVTARRKISGNSKIYSVEYNYKSGEAYDLLRHARSSEDCRVLVGRLHASRCKLALTGLPQSVYETKWDIIVVDGPSGGGPHEPGRMGTIYTVAALARTGDRDRTDVIVHNVDRTVERWFAWEFLCDENLVASKGRLWHFNIKGNRLGSSKFCSPGPIRIQ